MAKSRKRPHRLLTDHEMRDQEVMRANRELAAYFKGQRTEREAKAALKIIRAFLKERERTREKRPLPGRDAPKAEAPPTAKSKRKTSAQPARQKRRKDTPEVVVTPPPDDQI